MPISRPNNSKNNDDTRTSAGRGTISANESRRSLPVVLRSIASVTLAIVLYFADAEFYQIAWGTGDWRGGVFLRPGGFFLVVCFFFFPFFVFVAPGACGGGRGFLVA